PEALESLAGTRDAAGDQFGAMLLLEESMELRSPDGRQIMFEARDPAAAGQLARQAIDAGDTWALRMVAFGREVDGDHEGAERLARRAADAGDRRAMVDLAYNRPEDPRWRQLLRYGLEADGRISDPW